MTLGWLVPAPPWVCSPVQMKVPMSAADFLLSQEVQQIVKIAYAQTAEQFSAATLARMSRLELPTIEATLPHLVTSGILRCSEAVDGEAPAHYAANTAFVFYPELRRIALKSFAAAEPLRAMLRSKFRDSVLRAFILGEDEAAGALDLLIVHGEKCPAKEELDAALQRLRKSGALRLHLRVQVMPDSRFDDMLARQDPGSSASIEIVAAGETKARPSADRVGLFEKARRRFVAMAS